MIDVFLYWEGQMPAHVALCIASVRASLSPACRFNLVTPDNVAGYLHRSVIHPNAGRLREPAQRADCIRAALLAVYGGFYLDADTLGLRCPSAVASDHDLVYCVWSKPPRRVLNGYVYARPGSNLARAWLAEVNRRLASLPPSGALEWTGLGEKILTPLVAAASPGTVREVPRETFLPLDVDADRDLFFHDHDPAEFITLESVCFGLNNSWMMARHGQQMRALGQPTVGEPRTLVQRLFRDARQRIEDAR